MSRVKLKQPILGIDQLSDEVSLMGDSRQGITAIREATNVDIDTKGNLSRRKGYTKVLAGSGYHSLYKSARGWLMLCHGSDLGIYDTTTDTLGVLTTMSENYLTSFTELNNNMYFVNPGYKGMIFGTEIVVRTLGVPLPSVTPAFAGVTPGGFEAGTYAITYSVVNDLGEESALGPVATITFTEPSSIQGTLFMTLSGWKYRIYMTTVDGDELYQAAEFDADRVSFLIADHDLGRQPRTQFLEPLPFGYLITSHTSRLFIATTNFVYYSEPFLPHLTNAVHNFLPCTGFVTMVQSVNAGLFIGDQAGVRFYKGDDPVAFEVTNVSTEIPIFGSAVSVPGEYLSAELGKSDIAVIWLTSSGYHVGLETGEVVRLHTQQVQLPKYVQGCTAFAIQDGRKQVITPVNSNLLAGASVALDSTIG